jgi:hypothetical protein
MSDKLTMETALDSILKYLCSKYEEGNEWIERNALEKMFQNQIDDFAFPGLIDVLLRGHHIQESSSLISWQGKPSLRIVSSGYSFYSAGGYSKEKIQHYNNVKLLELAVESGKQAKVNTKWAIVGTIAAIIAALAAIISIFLALY